MCGGGQTGPYRVLGTELLLWDRKSPRHYVKPRDFIEHYRTVNLAPHNAKLALFGNATENGKCDKAC